MHGVRLQGLLMVGAAAFLWGLWPVFLHASSVSGPAAATITLALMSLPAPFVLRRSAFADRGAVWALVGVGVFDAITAGMYFTAVQRGPVVVAVLTHYLAPLLVTLGAPFILGEPRSRRALLAVPVVLVGLVMVLGVPHGEGVWLTAWLGGGSAVSFAGIVIFSKRAGKSFRPIEVTALHAPIAVALLLLVFRGGAVPEALDFGAFRAISGGLIAGLLGTVLFNSGLQRIPSSTASVLTYLEPVVCALVGVLVFGEAFGPLTVLGVALVVGAGVWVALEREPA